MFFCVWRNNSRANYDGVHCAMLIHVMGPLSFIGFVDQIVPDITFLVQLRSS